jgi:phytanoyl-CoA hydroxylase
MDVEAYRRDGFGIDAGAIPVEQLDALAVDLYGVFARAAALVGVSASETVTHETMSRLLGDFFARDRTAYLAAARQTQYLISVHRLGLSPPIAALLEQIGIAIPTQSTRPVIHFMADGLRFESGYHKSPAHQDWRSVQGSLDGLTLWLPLYDVGLKDFPLEVVPRSHRQGLLDSADDVFGHRVADAQIPPDGAFQPVPMHRGDVAVFSGFLVHRTGAEGEDRVRIAFSYRFNNALEPSYVQRRYPNPYSYRGDMNLLGFMPGAADVAPFFDAAASPAEDDRA